MTKGEERGRPPRALLTARMVLKGAQGVAALVSQLVRALIQVKDSGGSGGKWSDEGSLLKLRRRG